MVCKDNHLHTLCGTRQCNSDVVQYCRWFHYSTHLRHTHDDQTDAGIVRNALHHFGKCMEYTAMLMADQEGGCIRHSHIECRNEPDAGGYWGRTQAFGSCSPIVGLIALWFPHWEYCRMGHQYKEVPCRLPYCWSSRYCACRCFYYMALRSQRQDPLSIRRFFDVGYYQMSSSGMA